mmetsp:Transcript_23845/g.68486  ORF Transcript_23845/g.68486 Transcript_23845/m.68486 type:complete len:293 (+) Transcript_23845:116-994(+)
MPPPSAGWPGRWVIPSAGTLAARSFPTPRPPTRRPPNSSFRTASFPVIRPRMPTCTTITGRRSRLRRRGWRVNRPRTMGRVGRCSPSRPSTRRTTTFRCCTTTGSGTMRASPRSPSTPTMFDTPSFTPRRTRIRIMSRRMKCVPVLRRPRPSPRPKPQPRREQPPRHPLPRARRVVARSDRHRLQPPPQTTPIRRSSSWPVKWAYRTVGWPAPRPIPTTLSTVPVGRIALPARRQRSNMLASMRLRPRRRPRSREVTRRRPRSRRRLSRKRRRSKKAILRGGPTDTISFRRR